MKNCMHGRTLICENCVCVCACTCEKKEREPESIHTCGQIEVKTQNPGYLLESRGSLWFLYSYKKVFFCLYFLGFPGGASGKEPACQHRRCKRLKFDPWVRKIPWRRKWQLTPNFFLRESHGQRSLMGYSPWGRKELDTSEHILSGINIF